jgi:hypothetical protein
MALNSQNIMNEFKFEIFAFLYRRVTSINTINNSNKNRVVYL